MEKHAPSVDIVRYDVPAHTDSLPRPGFRLRAEDYPYAGVAGIYNFRICFI
jgi:hypothetical protein